MWELVNSETIDNLYRTATVRCGCGELDNDSRTIFSRIALPLILALGTLALRTTLDGDREDYADVRPTEKTDGNESRGKERMYWLDYARIACVFCVVSEHSGGRIFSDRNLLWVQQWVVPFLYVVSGISFMLSKSRLWKYELRLFVVLAVGTLANAIGDLVHGNDIMKNPFYTVYQMAYVAVIMIVSLLVAPIKEALQWRARNPRAPATWPLRVSAVVYGLVTALALTFFVGGWSLRGGDDSRFQNLGGGGADALLEAPLFISRSFGLFFLVSLTACWGYCSSAGWILMIISYAGHVLIPYQKGGHPLGPDLFLIGMVSHQWPLKHKAQVGRWLRCYWPPLVPAFLLNSMAYVSGRCDLHPLNTTWERFRFRFNESVLLTALLCGAFAADDPYKATPWLNLWALYAYCFHVCWARMLPTPYGAVLTYFSLPLFYLLHKLRRRRRDAHEEPATPESHDEVELPGLPAVSV